jgi:hypothetical protein
MRAQATVELPVRDEPLTRRFGLADLTRHAWVLPRLLKAYPHLTERSVYGWLQNIIYSSEYLFLFREHGVALAEVIHSHTLSQAPTIHERFVLAESEAYAADAAEFYTEFLNWARSHGAKGIIVEELSDVPHDLIRGKLGTIYNRQQKFARVP